MAQGMYRRHFNLDRWRERFKKTLAARFVLRFHMALILAIVAAAGLVTTRVLLAVGVSSMAVRYLVAVLAAYGAFFGLVRLWLSYLTAAVQREAPELHESDDNLVNAITPEPPPAIGAAVEGSGSSRRSGGSSNVDLIDPGIDLSLDLGSSSSSSSLLSSSSSSSSSSVSGGSGGGGGGLSLDLGDGDGFAAIIIIAVVAIVAAAIFGAAGYFIWEAPAILGEAAIEIVLASALIRASRSIDRPGWTGSVLRATWKPAMIVLVLATVGGLIAQGVCPKATTLPGVINLCVKDSGDKGGSAEETRP